MRRACSVWIAVVIVSLLSVPVAGQAPAATGGTTWRTPWGDPDLQGSWTNATITPLERPAKWAGRERLTAEEVDAFNREVTNRADVRAATPEQDVGQAYNAFWWDRGLSDGRTSLIVDPPDGRMPPLTPAAQKRREELRRLERTNEGGRGDGPFNGPEDLSLYTRCVIRAPLPRVPTGYDNNYEIVQGPGWVAIFQEQMHETRIIPLDGRPHITPTVRQWLGDSRGRWEGDTLVVETINFSDQATFEGSDRNMRLVERWTRVADDRLSYEFTIDDPTTWSRPWKASWDWNKVGMLYEYACHEGNLGLYGILEGARVKEREEGAKKGSSK